MSQVKVESFRIVDNERTFIIVAIHGNVWCIRKSSWSTDLWSNRARIGAACNLMNIDVLDRA